MQARGAGILPGHFETARLRLRPLQADDEDFYVHLYTNATVMRYVGAPLAPERARRAFVAVIGQMLQSPPAAAYWTVRDRSEAARIGLLALVLDGRSGEVGIMLSPHGQGRGYATEAVAALMRGVFADESLCLVRSTHRVGHPAMPRVLDKIGFSRTETRQGLVHWQMGREQWREAFPP